MIKDKESETDSSEIDPNKNEESHNSDSEVGELKHAKGCPGSSGSNS